MEGERRRELGNILEKTSNTNEKMTTRAKLKQEFCRLAELLRVAENSEARQEPEPEPEVVPESRVLRPETTESSVLSPKVHKVLVVAQYDPLVEPAVTDIIETAPPNLQDYVLESYDPRMPLPNLSQHDRSCSCPDDFMGESDNSMYDCIIGDRPYEDNGPNKLSTSEITWMMRDFDSIPCKGYLPSEIRDLSIEVHLDNSQPETLNSSHWSARCTLSPEELDDQMLEEQNRELGLSATRKEQPRCQAREGGACGQEAKKYYCKHRKCKHCNSFEHKSKDCDFLKNMVLDKGFYLLKNNKDSDEPSSSNSWSSIGNISLIFHDDQSPIGSDNLFYVPRQVDYCIDNEQLPSLEFLPAQISRLPASARKRQRPARPRTSSPVSAHVPARTCLKEKPPEIFLYDDDNCNAVENNLNKTDSIEDLYSLIDNFKIFPNNCQQQQASVTNCQTYSNCIIDSSIVESNVHKSLIPSVLAPDLSML